MASANRTLFFRSSGMDVRSVDFDVSTNYDLHEIIGEGAYGVVCSATHKPSGQKVAIKKIQPFDRPMFCLRTLREIKLLRHFNNENIISVLDIQPPRSFEAFTDVYLIQELMETDMSRVIRTQNLTDDHCQYFLYQILRAVKVMHSANVLHRDLKPSNLLLNANCDLKVCDFGLARSAATTGDATVGFMTEYVATRWYRAPEIMLTFQHYTKAIDMWSVGCILAEMLNGQPLFPGKDYCDQLALILEVLGTPNNEDFYNIKSTRARQYIRSMPFRKGQSLRELFPNANYLAVDLLSKLLTFSPNRRITVEEALEHPYVAQYHDPNDEPTAPPVPKEFFSFENGGEIPISELRRLIHSEIMGGFPRPLNATNAPPSEPAPQAPVASGASAAPASTVAPSTAPAAGAATTSQPPNSAAEPMDTEMGDTMDDAPIPQPVQPIQGSQPVAADA